jgi:hypothetical protein
MRKLESLRKSPADSPLGCLNGAREWRPAETEQPANRVALRGRRGSFGRKCMLSGPTQVMGLPLRCHGHRAVVVHLSSSLAIG